MQRFYLKKRNDTEIKERYQVKILNRTAALENSDDNVDIRKIRMSAKNNPERYDLKQRKPRFDEKCLK
jgi:hypothetical protein